MENGVFACALLLCGQRPVAAAAHSPLIRAVPDVSGDIIAAVCWALCSERGHSVHPCTLMLHTIRVFISHFPLIGFLLQLPFSADFTYVSHPSLSVCLCTTLFPQMLTQLRFHISQPSLRILPLLVLKIVNRHILLTLCSSGWKLVEIVLALLTDPQS